MVLSSLSPAVGRGRVAYRNWQGLAGMGRSRSGSLALEIVLHMCLVPPPHPGLLPGEKEF